MPQAEELFYLDENGEKQDRELHYPILHAVEPVIDEKIMGPIRARHRAAHVAQQKTKARAARWIKVKAKAKSKLRLPLGQNGLYRGWNEQDHPRHPAGSPQGGEFVGDGSSDGAAGGPDSERGDAAEADAGKPPRSFAREGASDAQRLRGIVAIWRPTPAAAEATKAAGNTPQTFYEHGGPAGATTFHNAITRAKSGPFGAAVTAYPVDEYEGMRLFLAPDAMSGFALKGDDIVSLFKHPDNKAKGVADVSLQLALNEGGKRLDAFDTVLPEIYSKNGFRAVARLKWSDEFAPDGWDYDAFKEFNGGRPDVVFMALDPAHGKLYKDGDGARVKDYDAGTAAQRQAFYRPGVRGRGTVEVERRRDEWVASSPIKTIDDVVAAAPIAQKAFAEAGRRIADELGVEFKDPGVKTSSPKGIARTEQKIAERNGLTARVTDTARGAFVLDEPEQAEAVIAKLARTHEVLAEPWRTIKDSHYTDRALLFRDRTTGLIGEVQITEPRMAAAKKIGHELYERARVMPAGPEKDALNAEMKALYDAVLDSYAGTGWAIVDGRSRS